MKHYSKCIGGMVLAFGVGMLISSFIPSSILIVIEALVIIIAGSILFL